MPRKYLSAHFLVAAIILATWFVNGSANVTAADEKRVAASEALFDADPAHPWNRLHALFIREQAPGGLVELGSGRPVQRPQLAAGQIYVPEGPDAPFGHATLSVIEWWPSHAQALAALDALLKNHDDARIADPLKRALLQRDLWYAFDKLAAIDSRPEEREQRQEVERRLAQVLRHLAQPAAQLQALPDNYAAAIGSKAFPGRFDPQHPAQPYLPPDLRLDGPGEWLPITSVNRSRLAAPDHVEFAGGRSVFVSLLRVPGGRKATQEFLDRMPQFDATPRNLPELPDGSQVAMLRRMVLVDERGELQLTPLTESIQLRVFPAAGEQSVVEFTLDRAGLLAGRGGLRATGPEETQIFNFGDAQHDSARPQPILWSCTACHGSDKLSTVATFGMRSHLGYQGATTTDLAHEVEETLRFKRNSYAWGLLQGLQHAGPR